MPPRSPMDLPIRGNLASHTVSFPAVVESCRDWLTDKAIEKAIDVLLDPLAGGPEPQGNIVRRKITELQSSDPNVDSAKGTLSELIKLTALYYWPVLQSRWPKLAARAATVDRALDGAVKTALKSRFGRIQVDVKRLLATAAGTKRPLDGDLRVVKASSRLLFEEARRYYHWTGTLADAAMGTVLAGADPSREFIVHIPTRTTLRLDGDPFQMRIIKQFQA